MVCRDGSRLPVLITGIMAKEAKDRVITYLVDYSRPKKVEAALKEERDQAQERARQALLNLLQLHAMFEGAPVGIGRLSRDGRWIAANARLTEILRCRPAELLEKNLTELWADEEGEAPVFPEIAKGKRYSADRSLKRGDGSVVWARISLTYVACEGAQFIAAAVDELPKTEFAKPDLDPRREALEENVRSLRSELQLCSSQARGEMEGRRRALRALHDSEQRFRQMSENIQEVFWMASPDGSKFHFVSPGYEKLWGRSLESLYRQPATWLEGIHAEDRARVEQAGERRPIPALICSTASAVPTFPPSGCGTRGTW
jgi:PAS domain S-box-containing protein